METPMSEGEPKELRFLYDLYGFVTREDRKNIRFVLPERYRKKIGDLDPVLLKENATLFGRPVRWSEDTLTPYAEPHEPQDPISNFFRMLDQILDRPAPAKPESLERQLLAILLKGLSK